MQATERRQVISSGAEAIVYKHGERVIKHRLKKSYRHPQIDLKFRTTRTKREAHILAKAAALGIRVPRILSEKAKEGILEMEFVAGKKMRDILDTALAHGGKPKPRILKLCKKIGEGIALLHKNHIVHGDLTTSNFIVSGGDIFFIDFGLSFHSTRTEDKAVDLHLMKRALASRHYTHWEELFAAVLEGYKKVFGKEADAVLKRLEVVESRGRYKGKLL